MQLTTYRIIAERAIRDLSGGDIPSDTPYSIPFAIQHARDGMALTLKMESLSKKGGGGDQSTDKNVMQEVLVSFPNREVRVDTVSRRTYIDLPSTFMSLKYNKGIHFIGKMGELKGFVRIANPQVTERLPVRSFEGLTYGWYLEGPLKAYFMRDILRDGVTKVMVKLITCSQFGDDDLLPLPEDLVGPVVDYVKSKMVVRNPQDRIEDNDPNLRALNEQQK